MTSYLRTWLATGLSSTIPDSEREPEPAPIGPSILKFSPPPSDDEADDNGDDTETERDHLKDDTVDDIPPAFPSLDSAQRVASSKLAKPSSSSSSSSNGTASTNSNGTIPRILTDAQLMPPPPLPPARIPGVPPPRPGPASSLRAGQSLAVPPSTTTKPTKPKSGKVALAPGHSPLDWANLKSSGADLRGVDTLLRIPPSVLRQHNKRDDAWSAFYGKVYNITSYLAFHPGGEKELLRVAGRDGTKLFASTHAWVNVDFMLDACLVGFLVPERSS